MNIAIVGAGIVGVTTAYELAADGHAVTVFERHGSAAEETSFANAGVVAPGYVGPWATPAMRRQVLAGLLGGTSPVRLRAPLGLDELAWGWRWLRACEPRRSARLGAVMHRLARYSQAQLHQVAAREQLEYERGTGYLVLLRTEREAARAASACDALREAGIEHALLTAAEARRIEPALHADTGLAAAIHLPQGEVGNCRQFALLLRERARALGARFEFNTVVEHIALTPRPHLRLANPADPRAFDAVVVCAGVASAALLRPLGLRLPLVGVLGWSISARLREPVYAPLGAVMDESRKVAISRIGQRVRVAGGAALGGGGRTDDEIVRRLYQTLQDWFPAAADFTQGVQTWRGARPMLPDGPPLVGASGLPGLWLNLGHGSSGWALACGSARILADQIAGRTPAIDTEDLGIERLGLRG